MAAGVVRKDVWRGNAGIDASLFLIMRVFIYINSSSQQKTRGRNSIAVFRDSRFLGSFQMNTFSTVIFIHIFLYFCNNIHRVSQREDYVAAGFVSDGV